MNLRLIFNRLYSTTAIVMESKSQLPKAPDGFQVLTEGKARILYKEQKLKPDENNMINAGRGKRQCTD